MKASALIAILQREIEQNSDVEVRFEDRAGYREGIESVRFSRAAEEEYYNEEDQIVLSR